MAKYTFTSESVCAGHPDKIADQISDAIVDAVLSQDKYGRVAVETLVTVNRVIIVGEVSAKAQVDYKKIAKEQIKRLGYTDPDLQFTDKSPITVLVHEQSAEIAKGVKVKGAGDQGMMFGYACRETDILMPMPIMIAHALARRIDEVREKKIIPHLRPDGKAQVTVEYTKGVPTGVTHVVTAVPHTTAISQKALADAVYKEVVSHVLSDFGFGIAKNNVIVNGTGVWHFSGPGADSGLTGRKIVVDTYGGYARVGGGAFSGKDPTKVDRSGAYAARYIAKQIVANKLAEKAEVRLAYFIGAKKPTMQEVETFGSAKKSDRVIKDFASKVLDTSVEGIIEGLQLRRPIYLPTAAYGHFGRPESPWENVIQ